jgi:hypothetical protein
MKVTVMKRMGRAGGSSMGEGNGVVREEQRLRVGLQLIGPKLWLYMSTIGYIS